MTEILRIDIIIMGNISITEEDNIVGIEPQEVKISIQNHLNLNPYTKQLSNCISDSFLSISFITIGRLDKIRGAY
jgi:hypothetical protein